MNPGKFYLFTATLFILFAGSGASIIYINRAVEPPPTLRYMFEAHETFDFEVRYGLMRVGNVYVSSKDTLINGKTYMLSMAVIESNSNLPLMGNRRYEYYSILEHNDTTAFSHDFWVDNIHRQRLPESRYQFDYENMKVISHLSGEITDTLDLNGPADGGLSLFYVGRANAGTEKSLQYPIFIDNQQSIVTVDNTLKTDRIRSDAFDGRMVDVFLSYGDANIEGPFGFTGKFESRFHTGEHRIPVEARVSVWIGNVRVRLTNFDLKL
ncbi:MAG: hypothetical protein LAT67_12650 [Balneolales bacterium]|nr:hypothetical protein [Balneolales bacterium]